VDFIGFFPPFALDWLDAYLGIVCIVTGLALGFVIYGVALIGSPR
jgi:hypothetical protein